MEIKTLFQSEIEGTPVRIATQNIGGDQSLHFEHKIFGNWESAPWSAHYRIFQLAIAQANSGIIQPARLDAAGVEF